VKKLGIIWGAALLLTLVLGLLVVPGRARAQNTTSEQLPELSRDWTARIGLWIFNSESARRASSDVGISAFAERTVYRGIGYFASIGIGYNGWDQVFSVPVTANLIGYKDHLRYGIGAGISFGQRIDGDGTTGAVIDLILGYGLTGGKTPLDLELRYYFVSGSSNELDGYSLTLGMHF
jgi:hypothetical protein